ncbi:MAG: hypothetical protein ACI9ES_001614 [Oceanospirillaceae bacterium]|jgi:hypothetical protein
MAVVVNNIGNSKSLVQDEYNEVCEGNDGLVDRNKNFLPKNEGCGIDRFIG